METTKYIGDLGENEAEKYLKARFWRILARNYIANRGEIDIVGYKNGILVYFEVKTRSSDLYGTPASAVDSKKIFKIKNAARALKEAYASGGRIPVFYPFGIKVLRPIKKERIDVIEVYLNADRSVREINHIKDWGNTL